MTELMTSLALLAYGTAAVVGIQLIASGASHLSGVVGRRDWRPARVDEGAPAQAALANIAIILAGLFLVLQGMVVAILAFG